MMNKQQIFDTVVKHLAQQKRRSMAIFVHREEEINTCAYRGKYGDMCAVGCLIKDEDYSPVMETNPVDDLVRKGLLPEYLKQHTGLLQALQLAHDSAFTVDYLTHMLRQTGKVYDLDVSAVANITEWDTSGEYIISP